MVPVGRGRGTARGRRSQLDHHSHLSHLTDIEEVLVVAGTPAWLLGGAPSTPHEIDHRAQLLAAGLGHADQLRCPNAALGLKSPVKVRPVDVLLRLAKATRLHGGRNPHVPWLRQLGWLLPGPGQLLRLNPTVARMSARQRRLAVHDLGHGLGLLLAEQWCRAMGWATSVSTVDLDVVLRDGYGWERSRRVTGRNRLPGTLLLVDDPALPTRKRIKLVAANTVGSAADMAGELARGLSQLAGLRVGGATPQGLAVTTVVGPEELSYRALAPEGGLPVELEVSSRLLDGVRRPKRVGRGPVLDLARADLVPTAVTVATGALAAFAGNAAGAARWLPPATVARLGLLPHEERVVQEAHDGRYVGVERTVPTGDGGRLSVFRGLAAGIDDAVGEARIEEIAERQLEHAVARRRSEVPLVAGRPTSDGTRSVSATSSDGAMLQISVV